MHASLFEVECCPGVQSQGHIVYGECSDVILLLLVNQVDALCSNFGLKAYAFTQVVVGGGQEASQVTTTAGKAGRFESRFFHKVTSIMTCIPLQVINLWPVRLCCGIALGKLMVSKVGHDAKRFEIESMSAS